MTYDFDSLFGEAAKPSTTAQPPEVAPPPAPGGYDFEALFTEAPRAPVEASLYEASFGNPDEEAQRRQVARDLGRYLGDTTPPAILDLPDAQRRLRAAEADHATRASPRTSAWLSSVENARIAADDAKTLAGIEKILDGTANFGRAVKKGAIFDAPEAFWGALSAPGEVAQQALKAAGLPEWAAKSELATLFRGLASLSKAGGEAVLVRPGETTLERGLVSGAESLGQSLVTLPAGVAARSAEFSTRLMALLSGGSSYLDAREEGESPLTALSLAVPDAVAEYTTERFGMDALFNQKAFRNAFLRQASVFAAKEMAGEQVATIWQDFNRWMVLNPEKSVAEFMAERPEAAAQTAIATLVGAGGQVAVVRGLQAVLDQEGSGAQAEAGAQNLEQLFKLASESLTKQRDADSFASFFQSVAPDASIFVNPQTLREALAAAGVAEDRLPSLAAQPEADNLSPGVEIPITELVTALAGTGAETALIPHLRLDPDAPTLAEVQANSGKALEFFQQEAAKALEQAGAQEEFRAAAETVHDDLLTEINAASPFGKMPGYNEGIARLTRDFYSTVASRMGITPLQLRDGWTDVAGVQHRGYRLKIRGAGGPAGGLAQPTGKPARPLPSETLREFGDFKTGTPVTFGFIHNTESATKLFGKPKKGDRYQRDIEPSGRYINAGKPWADMPKNLISGTVTFSNPLVLNGENWKQTLFDHYKKRGKALSLALIADGHDGVVTVDKYGPGEILDLTTFDEAKALYQPAYHGSPYRFDKFSLEHLGKGEGAQAFGWGLYFAGKREIAEWYRENLTKGQQSPAWYDARRVIANAFGAVDFLGFDSWQQAFNAVKQDGFEGFDLSPSERAAIESAIQGYDALRKNTGQLYEVEIPEDSEYLLWDKPLRGQDIWDRIYDAARERQESIGDEAVLNIAEDMDEGVDAELTGGEFYDKLKYAYGDEDTGAEAASKYLHSLGIAGIKYADATARGKTEDSFNYVIFDENAVKIAQTFYQQQRDQQRAAFSPTTLDLTLLAKADLSSYLHELGHFFLTVYGDLAAQPDAPADIRADMDALLKWFDPSFTLDQWHAMSLDQQRPFHERAAESFEQYLFTGKAPTKELQPLFRRLASWMGKVYGTIREFLASHGGAQLNPEVSAVFDRMLATDAEIAAMKDVRAYTALFRDAAEAGMSPADFAAYQVLDPEALEDAEEQLRTRGLRDMKWLQNRRNKVIAELQEEAKEKRAELRAQVVTEVAAEPLYRAMRWLKRGEMTTEQGEEIKAEAGHRLRIADLEAMFPAGALDTPNWRKLGYGKYGMLAEEGLHPDLVADMFPGFTSGESLVRQLIDAPRFNDEVEARTDRRMMEEHGDLSDSAAIERAADEALHNDIRTRMVATEMWALDKRVGAPAVLMRAAREYARQVVATKSLKTLKPAAFAAAETRAGKAAAEALRKGDRAEAARQKRAELLNHAAAKEAYAGLRELEKKVARLQKIASGKDDVVGKTRDMDLVNTARAILAEFGIGTKGEAAAHYLDLVEKNNPDLAAVLADTVRETTAGAKDYKTLSLTDMRELSEAVESVWFLAKRSRQMEVDGKLVSRHEVEQALWDRLDAIGIPDRIPGEGSAVTPAEKRGMLYHTFLSALRRVESWAGAMDGSQPMGPFRRYVFAQIKDAADRYRSDKARVLKAYRDLLAPVAPTLERRLIEAPELGYTFGKSEGGMGKVELLHAILHTGNASNKRKLLLGRRWGAEDAAGEVDTSKWDAFLTRMVNEGVLTKADFDFAQGVWDLLESLKPLAQKTHRDVFGRYFAEVTADSFTDPFGVLRRGGYVPAMADSDAVLDADLRALAEAENENMKFAFPTPAKGFTKARVEYNRPLKLDLRTLTSHIDKVLLFSHLTQPVNDVRRVLSSKQVGQALGRVDPAAVKTMLTPWLNRAAKQVVEARDPADAGMGRFWAAVRARAGMAAMFANVANAAQQITGLSLAAVRVKPRYLMEALAHVAKAPRQTAEWVAGQSLFMEQRLNSEVEAMSGEINDILINPGVFAKGREWTRRHAYFLQSAVDSVISPVVWLGAYNQALEQGQSERDAIRLADATVRETQGANTAEDVAKFETGSAFYRMFTQFAGYFNMNANLLGSEFAKISREMGLKKGAGRGLYVLLLGFFAPAMVGELIMQAFKGGPDDEDDDGVYLDDWLASMFSATLRYGTAMIPVGGQTANAIVNRMNDKPYDDRMSTAPAISMAESAINAPFALYKAIAEEGKPSRAIKDVATLLSLTLGVPASGMARPVSYLADVQAERVEPTGPVDLLRGTITGVASPESKQ